MTTASMVGRLGGLAAALGVGAVIAFVACASASAAPTDTADSSSRADSADRSEAPARRASAGNRNHTGLRIAVRSATPAVSSRVAPAIATTISNAQVGILPEPVGEEAAAVIPWREARKSISRVAQSAVNAPASEAQAGTITFPWCDPRGRQITIYKGTHFAIPNSFGYFITQTVGTGTFTSNSVYDLKDVDQYDWNKFTGIAFTPLEPDRNSAMVGWRYNLTTEEFEIAPFYNVDKIRILPNENPLSPNYEVISVPPGEPFQFDVDYTGITLTYGDRTVFKPYPTGLVPNVWTAARVSGWFGGNEVTPRTLSYFLNLT